MLIIIILIIIMIIIIIIIFYRALFPFPLNVQRVGNNNGTEY